jgi:predicted transposase YbfD/YdcC
MSTAATTSSPLAIAHHFANVPDPRHWAFRKRHGLDDILVIAFASVLSGCKSWEAIADFGVTKKEWFLQIGLKLSNGIPSHDTFRWIFSHLEPRAFQNAFTSWINSVCSTIGLRHIPIDGQTLRGTRGPDGTCLHLVSAWAAQCRLTLAQVAVQNKSNEITAIPELLKLLDLHGALVSIDAMGCQKEIAKQIRAGKGDYILGLKENQPTLFADVEACFLEAYAADFEGYKTASFTTQEIGHGRSEERVYTVIYDPEGLSTQEEWVDLNSVVQVIRTRREGDKESVEVSYYISSSKKRIKVLANGIRAHWGIENGCHWSLDVLFAQDRCRTRHKNAAENLAWMRKMALALLRHDDSKGSAPTKMVRAAASDEYRSDLLDLLCQ